MPLVLAIRFRHDEAHTGGGLLDGLSPNNGRPGEALTRLPAELPSKPIRIGSRCLAR